MEPKILPPFSARNRGAHIQVDSDFPESARTGLLHLLHDLVEKNYVGGWITLVREMERIARVSPVLYNKDSVPDMDRAREKVEKLILGLSWDRLYDFCERLYGYLTQEVTAWDFEFGQSYVAVSHETVQSHVADELSRLLLEENLAFEFCNGRIERRGRSHTSTQVTRAQVVLGDPRLESARKHFNKGLKYFQHVSQPDPENAVKEAVCAVEATARALFPSPGAKTLSDIVKSITGNEPGKLPNAMPRRFTACMASEVEEKVLGTEGLRVAPPRETLQSMR
jgi:hypothetical protein